MLLIQQRNSEIHITFFDDATLFLKWSQKTENSCFLETRYWDEGNGGRPSTAGGLPTTYNETRSCETLNF